MPTLSSIGISRLSNLRIAQPAAASPAETVRALGMVQAQDYLGALWAVGLRTPGATEAEIERALATGQIIRTWPARGTLHFVAAEDIGWLLGLLTERVIRGTAGRYRQLELSEADFARSREWLRQALQGGKRLTRPAVYQGLEQAGVSMAGQRGIHILGRLAMEGLICFGPREGKQQTFVLLDEWVPKRRQLSHEQSLAELARRYFGSHGPATLKDLAWWAGLTLAEAKQALELVQDELEEVTLNGGSYWLRGGLLDEVETSPNTDHPPVVHLLPAFDEYLVGYRDRRAVLDPRLKAQALAGGMFKPIIVIAGQVAGTWKRKLKKRTVAISAAWFEPPDEPQQRAFVEAAERYAKFLGLELEKP